LVDLRRQLGDVISSLPFGAHPRAAGRAVLIDPGCRFQMLNLRLNQTRGRPVRVERAPGCFRDFDFDHDADASVRGNSGIDRRFV
jgi:hypothetical protein